MRVKTAPPPSLGDYLTVGEAAAVLGVCVATLRNWDRTGKLKATRNPHSRYRLYRRDELDALLRQVAGGPGPGGLRTNRK